MNSDVIEALEALRAKGILSEAQAAILGRPYRGELVSVHAQLRIALYLGVLLATGGVGIFLKENGGLLGPTIVASLLGAAAAICLFYVFRRSPPFSWEAVPSPHLAVDYVLLLGVLLLGSDLAFVENQFRWLGSGWPLHLLILSVLYGLFAYRFDSRVVLSLALSTFAAWRGVSTALPFFREDAAWGPAVRWNAIGCGALFLAAGALSQRWKRKAHFEPVYATLGLLLALGGLVSGVLQGAGSDWLLWEIPLWIGAAVVVAVAYRLRRPLDFALGVLAAYVGVLRLLGEVLNGSALAFTIAFSSLAVLVFLIRAHRRMRGLA